VDTARYVNPSCQLTQLAPSDGSPGLVTANAQHYLDIKWKFLFLYVSKSPKEAKPAAFIFGLILTTPAQFPTGSPKPLLSSLRQAGMDSLPPDNTQGHLTGADAATAAGLLVRLLRPVLERDGGTGSAIQSPEANNETCTEILSAIQAPSQSFSQALRFPASSSTSYPVMQCWGASSRQSTVSWRSVPRVRSTGAAWLRSTACATPTQNQLFPSSVRSTANTPSACRSQPRWPASRPTRPRAT